MNIPQLLRHALSPDGDSLILPPDRNWYISRSLDTLMIPVHSSSFEHFAFASSISFTFLQPSLAQPARKPSIGPVHVHSEWK